MQFVAKKNSNKVLTMRTKIFMILVTVVFATSCVSTRKASYTHHLCRSDASIVSCSVVNLDGDVSLCIDVAGLSFATEPRVRFVNWAGEELVLKGMVVDTYEKLSSGDSFSVHHSLAQFPLCTGDVAFFRSGVKELWIGTLPYVHDHTFSGRRFGKKLNRLILRARMS